MSYPGYGDTIITIIGGTGACGILIIIRTGAGAGAGAAGAGAGSAGAGAGAAGATGASLQHLDVAASIYIAQVNGKSKPS
jgi:hypothetical protein